MSDPKKYHGLSWFFGREGSRDGGKKDAVISGRVTKPAARAPALPLAPSNKAARQASPPPQKLILEELRGDEWIPVEPAEAIERDGLRPVLEEVRDEEWDPDVPIESIKRDDDVDDDDDDPVPTPEAFEERKAEGQDGEKDETTAKVDEPPNSASAEVSAGDHEADQHDTEAEDSPDAGEEYGDDSDWSVDDGEQQLFEEDLKVVPGHESWVPEEMKLYRHLVLRGQHPLMPTLWAQDFLGTPLPPSLFAPADSDKRVCIHHRSNQFRATKALASLFELPSRINGYQQSEQSDQIPGFICKQIDRYIMWAAKDAGLDNYEFFSNISVREFRPATLDELEEVQADADRRGPEQGDNAARDSEEVEGPDSPQPELSLKERRKIDLVKRVETHLVDHARRHSNWYAKQGIRKRPRIIYLFAVYQHNVLVMTKNTNRLDLSPSTFAHLNLSRGQYWLDSALGISITVNLAREALVETAKSMSRSPGRKASDPDA